MCRRTQGQYYVAKTKTTGLSVLCLQQETGGMGHYDDAYRLLWLLSPSKEPKSDSNRDQTGRPMSRRRIRRLIISLCTPRTQRAPPPCTLQQKKGRILNDQAEPNHNSGETKLVN